jgi:hypothetical protein
MAARGLHLVPRVASGAVLFDQGNFAPYYVDALCAGFQQLGLRARVVASPPLFDAMDPAGRHQVEHQAVPFTSTPGAPACRSNAR